MKNWQALVTVLVVIVLVIIGIVIFRKPPQAPTMTPPTITNGSQNDIPTIPDVCKGENPPSDCVKG